MKFKIAISTLASLGLVLASQLPAQAVFKDCRSQYYACTLYGYDGHDPYLYQNSSQPNSTGTMHNCTSYAAYVISVIGIPDSRYSQLGNASTWASRAAGFGIPVTHTAHINDIAQWDWGHVAFVEDVVYGSTGSLVWIVISEDNLGGDTRRIRVFPGSNWPDNFISFPLATGGGGGKPMQMQSITLPTN